MKQPKDVRVLGEQDATNYREMVDDLINENKLPAGGTLDYIVQFFSIDAERQPLVYIATHVRISGPTVSHPSGPDAEWRRWIHVDGAWEPRIFTHKHDANAQLANVCTITRGFPYTIAGDNFHAADPFVFDLRTVKK